MRFLTIGDRLNMAIAERDNYRQRYEEERALRMEIERELNALKGAVMGKPKGDYTNATHEPSNAVGEIHHSRIRRNFRRGIL